MEEEQTKSKMWFSQRAGRITASRFKAAARTDVNQPSQSLIKYICYPESLHFKSKATEWGCVHERDALAAGPSGTDQKEAILYVNNS